MIDVDDATRMVADQLATNPFRARRGDIARDRIEQFVRRECCDIAPWPFTPLSD